MRQHHFTRRLLTILLAVAGILTIGAPAGAQNLLTNASFESGHFVNGQGGQGAGLMLLNAPATDITGWTLIDQIVWGTTPNSNAITAADGLFALDLQGANLNGAPFGGVSQTITTVVGGQYHFSFYLGVQEDIFNDRGPVSVSASAGGITQPFTYNPGGTGVHWGQFGFDFTATSTSTPISVTGTLTTGGAFIGLDQLSVTSVPEPSTSLLAVGIAAAVTIRRKRRAERARAGDFSH